MSNQDQPGRIPKAQSIEERLTRVEHICNVLVSEVDAAKHPHHILEPVFELDVVATLVPLEFDRLKEHLKRNKDYTRLYRKGRDRRLRRLLPISDIKKIRSRVLRGPDLEKFIR